MRGSTVTIDAKGYPMNAFEVGFLVLVLVFGFVLVLSRIIRIPMKRTLLEKAFVLSMSILAISSIALTFLTGVIGFRF